VVPSISQRSGGDKYKKKYHSLPCLDAKTSFNVGILLLQTDESESVQIFRDTFAVTS
jgi:hypothetical protein